MKLQESIKRILIEEISKKNFQYEKKKSNIHGFGVFATNDIEKNQKGLAAKILDNGFYYTNLGKYLNHSKNPNVKIIIKNMKVIVVPLRKIKKGEEIICDYDTNPYGMETSDNIENRKPFSHCKVTKISHKIFDYFITC